MGMGLKICRTIIESHGGRIWAKAGDAGGLALSFSLPLAHDENMTDLENDDEIPASAPAHTQPRMK